MSNSQSILLIESDVLLQSFIVKKLTEMGCEVDVANNFVEAKTLKKTGHYDLVLQDLPKPFSLNMLEWRLKNSRVATQATSESLSASA